MKMWQKQKQRISVKPSGFFKNKNTFHFKSVVNITYPELENMYRNAYKNVILTV